MLLSYSHVDNLLFVKMFCPYRASKSSRIHKPLQKGSRKDIFPTSEVFHLSGKSPKGLLPNKDLLCIVYLQNTSFVQQLWKDFYIQRSPRKSYVTGNLMFPFPKNSERSAIHRIPLINLISIKKALTIFKRTSKPLLKIFYALRNFENSSFLEKQQLKDYV